MENVKFSIVLVFALCAVGFLTTSSFVEKKTPIASADKYEVPTEVMGLLAYVNSLSWAEAKAFVLELPLDTQYELWKAKFRQQIACAENTLDRAHLQKVQDFLTPEVFYATATARNLTAEAEAFRTEWVATAQSELGWTMDEVGMAIYSLQTGTGTVGSIPKEWPHAFVDCDCRWFCSGSNIDCVKKKCDKKGGCGFLWAESCVGSCEIVSSTVN